MRLPVRLAAAALSLTALITPCAAQAAERPEPPAQVREGSPASTVDRVADFYGAYIDAVTDGTDRLPDQLRAHYLTPALQHRLTAWENANHADGVLRAQDVPRRWKVRYDGSGTGHAFTTVVLTWGSDQHPTYTRLAVQSDLRTKLISDIRQA